MVHKCVFCGTQIKTYGEKTLSLDFGLQRKYDWTFTIADVHTPIIGADYLFHFDLLIDLKKSILIDRKTNSSTIGIVKHTKTIAIKVINNNHKYQHLLIKYKQLLTLPENKVIPTTGTFHHIVTHGPPVTTKARRLSPEKYNAAKIHFDYLIKKGICRPSKSQWSSALHMVLKKDNT